MRVAQNGNGGGKMALITLAPGFQPETIEAKEATPEQLYSARDAWLSHRARYGRGRTEQAIYAKSVANAELGRIKRELRRRGLPSGSLGGRS